MLKITPTEAERIHVSVARSPVARISVAVVDAASENARISSRYRLHSLTRLVSVRDAALPPLFLGRVSPSHGEIRRRSSLVGMLRICFVFIPHRQSGK